jgi:PAS domain S-box-containing protein
MNPILAEQTPTFYDENHFLSMEMNLFYWTRLKVIDIMSLDVVRVSPEETVKSAAQLMTEKRISCVLVYSDNEMVGILSQKDLMNSIHLQPGVEEATVGEVMSQPVRTIGPQTPILYASMLMDEMGIKRLPVVSENGLLGIVTQTDLVRAYESLSALRSITEIMTVEVATIAPEQSVAEAIGLMVEQNLTCVLITRNGKAEGILTEKDVLRSVLSQGRDPHETPVVDVMSFPLITVLPSHSVLSVSRIMDDQHLHRVVVADDNGTLGIITRTDIIRGYQSYAQREHRRELHMLTHATDAMVLLDLEGRATYMNPAFLELFGVDSPDVFIDQVFPPDAFWADTQDQYNFKTEGSFEREGLHELNLRNAAGDPLPISLYINNINDHAGNAIGRQAIAWNSTKRS